MRNDQKTIPPQYQYHRSICQMIFLIIVSTTWLLLTPLGELCMLPFYIYRLIVLLFSKLFKRSTLRGMLKDADVVFGHDDIHGDRPFNCSCFMKIDTEEWDIELFRAKVQANAVDAVKNNGRLLFPKLTSTIKPWMGYKFWAICESFKIEEHVLFAEDTGVPIPNWDDEYALQKFTKSLLARPWRKGKPLWDIVVLRNFNRSFFRSGDSENGTLFLWRQHHVLSAAVASQQLLMTITETKGAVELPNFSFIKDSRPMWLTFALGICKSPYYVCGTMLDLVNHRSRFPMFGVRSDEFFSSPDHTIPLQDVKCIRNAFGVDFIVVLLAAMTSTIRKLYTGRKKIPSYVGCGLPIVVPTADGLNNNVSGGIVMLPIGTDDPVERLYKIHYSVQNFKGISPLITHYLGTRSSFFPNFMFSLLKLQMMTMDPGDSALGDMLPPFVLTNIIGPPCATYIHGNRVSEQMADCIWPWVSPRGALMLAWTVEGNQHFKVVGGSNIFANYDKAEQFVSGIEEEFMVLKDLATEQGV